MYRLSMETFNIVLCYVILSSGVWTWKTVLWVAIGWIVGISLGMLCCIYVATLHENDLWFSNIKVRIPKDGLTV